MATTRMPAATTTPLLEVTDLVVDYRGRGRKVVRAVDGVSLRMEPGSVLALIGESGSGKTSLARAVCGLLPYAGTVQFEGQTLDRSTLKPGRVRPIQIVHQNPFSALNPRWPIWKSVAEPIIALNRQLKRKGDARAQAHAALVRVGLAEHLHDRLPHRVSGGQCQRVAIARAVATETKLLVLDEAVSALDAAVKKDILKLLRDLAVEEQVSYLFVTHDMATVADIASHVAVMESGRLVETGTSRDVLLAPREDYTRQLISAVPTLPREGVA
jgi:ABC-type glutathione transport system ATPase component